MVELINWFKSLLTPLCPVCGKRLYRGNCPWRFTDLHNVEEPEVRYE